jgi:hypothetical protein
MVLESVESPVSPANSRYIHNWGARFATPIFIRIESRALRLSKQLCFELKPQCHIGALDRIEDFVQTFLDHFQDEFVLDRSENAADVLNNMRDYIVQSFEEWQALVDDWKESAIRRLRSMHDELAVKEAQIGEHDQRINLLSNQLQEVRSERDDALARLQDASQKSTLSLPEVPSYDVSRKVRLNSWSFFRTDASQDVVPKVDCVSRRSLFRRSKSLGLPTTRSSSPVEVPSRSKAKTFENKDHTISLDIIQSEKSEESTDSSDGSVSRRSLEGNVAKVDAEVQTVQFGLYCDHREAEQLMNCERQGSKKSWGISQSWPIRFGSRGKNTEVQSVRIFDEVLPKSNRMFVSTRSSASAVPSHSRRRSSWAFSANATKNS